MKKISVLFLLLFFNYNGFSQESFQGIITYKIELETKESMKPSARERMHNNYEDKVQMIFSKTGNFKRVYFNKPLSKADINIYKADKGLLYFIDSRKPHFEVIDVKNNINELISKKQIPNEIIMGLDCECIEYKAIASDKLFILNFCYSKETPFLDPEGLKHHNNFFFNDFIGTSQRPYLKYSCETDLFKFSYIATDIEAKEIDDSALMLELSDYLSNFNKKPGSVSYKGEQINLVNENFQAEGIWKLYDDNRDLLMIFEMKYNRIVSDIKVFRDSQLVMIIDQSDLITYFKGKNKIHIQYDYQDYTFNALDGENIDEATEKMVKSMLDFPAQYYGGNGALQAFIMKNIDHDKISNHRGTVTVIVNIDRYGNVMVEDIKGGNPVLNEEVLKVYNKMPRWQPRFREGRLARTNFSYRINF